MAKKYLFIGGPLHGDRIMVNANQNTVESSSAYQMIFDDKLSDDNAQIEKVGETTRFTYVKRHYALDGKRFEFFSESNTTDEAISALLERPLYTLL